MKSVDPKKENWREINKIVLVVNTVDFDYSEKLTINLNCNFENISKGRCSVRINEKKKKQNIQEIKFKKKQNMKKMQNKLGLSCAKLSLA